MKDNLSIVISMVIFVILIVIFPLYNYFERQDDMSYNLALKTTTNFVDEVTEAGYLDQDAYNRFVEELSDTGNVYDIQLEAHRKVLTEDKDTNSTYNEQYLIDYNDQIFSADDNKIKTNLNERTIKDNAYYFNEGDQFYVKLKNSNTTMAGAIFNTIVPSSKKDRIVVNYGGIIKNQAWAKVDATYNALEKIEYDTVEEKKETIEIDLGSWSHTPIENILGWDSKSSNPEYDKYSERKKEKGFCNSYGFKFEKIDNTKKVYIKFCLETPPNKDNTKADLEILPIFACKINNNKVLSPNEVVKCKKINGGKEFIVEFNNVDNIEIIEGSVHYLILDTTYTDRKNEIDNWKGVQMKATLYYEE